MKRRLQSLVCLIAALHLVGGHWGVLQIVAWARMLENYTEERGLIVGVKETFDGNHACDMCKKIEAEKGKERQEQLPSTKGGHENFAKWFGMSSTTLLPEAPWNESPANLRHDALLSHPTQWDAQPPVPPPEFLS